MSNPPIHPLGLDDDTWLLVLTGAGVSAESGIPTFRAAGGLWRQHQVSQVASPHGFAADPALVWQFYSERRDNARGAAPNPGHLALVEAEKRLGDRFLLATQNVDGLHPKAGSERLYELHGNLFKSRCATCDRPPFDDDASYPAGKLPGCGKCHERGTFSLLRPHIVWFGEALDGAHLDGIDRFLRKAAGKRLIFLAAGTSGVVNPAAALVDVARQRGADTWLVNADPPENRSSFAHFLQGKSGDILPRLLG